MNSQSSRTAESQPVEIDTSRKKVAFVVSLGILLALAVSYFLSNAFQQSTPLSFVITSIFLLAFMVVFVFQTLLIKSPRIYTATSIGEALAFALFFYPLISSMLTLATLGLFFAGIILLLLAGRTGRQRLNDGLKINFWSTTNAILRRGIGAVALIIVVLFVSAFGNPSFTFTQNLVNVTFASFEGITRQFIPSFSLDAKVGDVIKGFAIRNLSEEQKRQLESLPAGTQDKLLDQNAQAIQEQINSLFGKNAVTTETNTRETIENIFTERISQLNSAKKTLLIFGGGLTLWWILRLVLWPLLLLANILGFLIYQILLSTGTIKLLLETRSREILVM